MSELAAEQVSSEVDDMEDFFHEGRTSAASHPPTEDASDTEPKSNHTIDWAEVTNAVNQRAAEHSKQIVLSDAASDDNLGTPIADQSACTIW